MTLMNANEFRKSAVSKAKEPDQTQIESYAANVSKAHELFYTFTMKQSLTSFQSLQATSFVTKTTLVDTGKKAHGLEEPIGHDVGSPPDSLIDTLKINMGFRK